MLFIGQNSKPVHMTCIFFELLIFFWLTLVDIYCLQFVSHYIKEILYVNTTSKGNHETNTKRYKFLFVSDNDVPVELKFLINDF